MYSSEPKAVHDSAVTVVGKKGAEMERTVCAALGFAQLHFRELVDSLSK